MFCQRFFIVVISEASKSNVVLPNVKVRLEQVLMSEPGPAILYKLGNLIKFYQTTIGYVHSVVTIASYNRQCLDILVVAKFCFCWDIC